jgi:PHD/YefM family antitoxin component YafN of YafNO toxin-antitoxin module
MATAITSRDILRNYKGVFKRVQETKQPALFYNRKEPQVAIVSLDDYQRLQDLRRRNSGRGALKLIKEVHELLKDEHLPPDLSQRHDYYLWEER